MGKKILFIISIPNQAKKFWGKEKYKNIIEVASQYELENINLEKYEAIIFSMYIDQYILLKLGDKLRAFLTKDKKILFNGHIVKPFFKELATFIPTPRPTLEEFKIVKLQEHPIYKNININILYKRKGVAGFFSRGSNPPPKNAKQLMAIKNSEIIVDWEYMINGGILYVHSGNDLWCCMEKEEGNIMLFNNIVDWILGDINE